MTGPASVAVGANAVYTITVTNHGTATATSVHLVDPTPTGLVFVSNTGDCTTAFPCALGTLTPGATRSITATFTVPATYVGVTPYSNAARVSVATRDPIAANNSATVSTVVTGIVAADLSVSMVGPPSTSLGGSVVYTITVKNFGPSAATSVQVADTTPSGLTFVSSAGDCTTAFPCALGTLAVGDQRVITATYAVPTRYAGPPPIRNSASVSSAVPDPILANNTAGTSTLIWLSSAFYTLTPCRLVDTRDFSQPAGWGPPALQPLQERTFTFADRCGVPMYASGLALNVTVTQGAAPGDLRLFPADATTPLVSTINFAAGQTRANNAIVVAGHDGLVSVKVRNDSAGPVDLILDVSGYFQ